MTSNKYNIIKILVLYLGTNIYIIGNRTDNGILERLLN